MTPLRPPADQLPADRPLSIYGLGRSGRICQAVVDAACGRPATGFIDSLNDGDVDGLAVRQIDAICDEVLRAPFEDVAGRCFADVVGRSSVFADDLCTLFDGAGGPQGTREECAFWFSFRGED